MHMKFPAVVSNRVRSFVIRNFTYNTVSKTVKPYNSKLSGYDKENEADGGRLVDKSEVEQSDTLDILLKNKDSKKVNTLEGFTNNIEMIQRVENSSSKNSPVDATWSPKVSKSE